MTLSNSHLWSLGNFCHNMSKMLDKRTFEDCNNGSSVGECGMLGAGDTSLSIGVNLDEY